MVIGLSFFYVWMVHASIVVLLLERLISIVGWCIVSWAKDSMEFGPFFDHMVRGIQYFIENVCGLTTFIGFFIKEVRKGNLCYLAM